MQTLAQLIILLPIGLSAYRYLQTGKQYTNQEISFSTLQAQTILSTKALNSTSVRSIYAPGYDTSDIRLCNVVKLSDKAIDSYIQDTYSLTLPFNNYAIWDNGTTYQRQISTEGQLQFLNPNIIQRIRHYAYDTTSCDPFKPFLQSKYKYIVFSTSNPAPIQQDYTIQIQIQYLNQSVMRTINLVNAFVYISLVLVVLNSIPWKKKTKIEFEFDDEKNETEVVL
ncbi:Hypothetical_protein [Hexamita inflata]|uniref:Hypothetical_protein n=1 Tax=Hexamita inflata TaxID=28002 RepID=A0AA86QDM8_9EUKA|nr:Hypothetical protein HINF_LOCUS44989 [Hexamita inflata]CAI9970819.1 Hypothetical protein HINF_LOCUS58464 [Hexamita inflata]